MADCDYRAIEALLDRLLQNKPIEDGAPPEGLERIQEKIVKLQKLHGDLQRYTVNLSQGDIDVTPPPRDNYLAAGLKQLQAQMLHLSWQAQRVAQGDYSQRIDFMGDFSNSFNDMTDQLRQRETHLREQQEAMVGIFDRIEPIFVVDNQENPQVLYVNKQAAECFSLESGAKVEASGFLADVLSVPMDNGEHQLEDAQTGKWFSVSTCRLLWEAHQSAQLFSCRDITSHKERETSLDIAANTDKLTGIPNRRAFEHSFKRLWEACLQAEKTLSVIFFDIDKFKTFNDTYGHLEGDKALAHFAQILKQRISRTDDVIARYGGEEFVVLLPFTRQESAVHVAESVRMMTEESRITLNNGDNTAQVRITVSGGVASVTPKAQMLPSDLISAADSALYSAKQSGRNRIHCSGEGVVGDME